MKLSGIDANLLIALDALLRERNVTRAAARLGIGQPALSHSLARLRSHFKDPLLVPHGRELRLSTKASRLVESVAAATAALASVFEERPGLDLDASRKFIIAGADWAAMIPLYSQHKALMIRNGLEYDPPYLNRAFNDLADGEPEFQVPSSLHQSNERGARDRLWDHREQLSAHTR